MYNKDFYKPELWEQYRDTRYDVSSKGRVRSTERPDKSGHVRKNGCTILKQKLNKNGYLSVCIYGKWVFVHRLVAECFVEREVSKNVDVSKLVVDHINNVKTDNEYTNLQWLTYSENTTKAYKDGLISEVNAIDKEKKRKRFVEINKKHKKSISVVRKKDNKVFIFDSAREASKKFNKHRAYFSEIITKSSGENKYWKAEYFKNE